MPPTTLRRLLTGSAARLAKRPSATSANKPAVTTLPNLPKLPNAAKSEEDTQAKRAERVDDLLQYEAVHLAPLYRKMKPFYVEIRRPVYGSDAYVSANFNQFKATESTSTLQRLAELRKEFAALSDSKKAKYGAPSVIASIDPKSLRRGIYVPPPKRSTRAQNVYLSEQFAKLAPGSVGVADAKSAMETTNTLLQQFAALPPAERQQYEEAAAAKNAELEKARAYYHENNPAENELLRRVWTLQYRLRRLGASSTLPRVRACVAPAESVATVRKQFEDRAAGAFNTPKRRALSGYALFSKDFAAKFFEQYGSKQGDDDTDSVKVSGRDFVIAAGKQWQELSAAEKAAWNDKSRAVASSSPE